MTIIELPTHELPMRAADIDILHHVNNIVYVDYAAEARALLAREGRIDGSAAVQALDVQFVRPLQLSRRPVIVASAWRDGVLVQDIRAERGGEVSTYAHLETTFGAHQVMEPRGEGVVQYPTRVRKVDMGEDGFSTLSKIFELFQEGRTLYVTDLLAEHASNGFVIAQVRVELGPGIRWQPDGYMSQSWMAHVGTSS
ncbi:MAG: hypothetical protein JWP31_329, partial [Aeromicrobium sp.]|nr:hypothetical protein [Aeromicrobium sp.]